MEITQRQKINIQVRQIIFIQLKQNQSRRDAKMGNACKCIQQDSSEGLSFERRNRYNPHSTIPSSQPQKFKIIFDRIATGQPEGLFKQITSYVAECPKLQFVDPNFKHLELTPTPDQSEPQSMKKFYNFQKLQLQKVYQNYHDTPLNVLKQQELELSYLCSVFYFICQTNEMKEKIFITQYINPHSAYILRLYCNGQPSHVIVDQKVPTMRHSIKYLSIRHPQEIWPFLLEKAWCKQIGSYDKARGLSPEDCYEEITGLPAYSISFVNQYGPGEILDSIISALRKKYWIVLTAKSNLSVGLKPRQVFYIQRYSQSTQTYKLRSPFTQFSLSSYKIEHEGQIQLSFNQILAYFQYSTLGAYQPNFTTTSCKFSSVKNQQNIFEINVQRPGNANIRVIQFYAEYLSENEKLEYKYSPVLMQLYNQQFTLVDTCQGLLQNLQGVRSSKLSNEFFTNLQPGKYYLRVQVNWESQKLVNSANVLIYSPKNFMTINKFQGDSIDLIGKLLAYTLEQPSIQIINGDDQEVRIRFVEKNYGYIVGVENLSENDARLKILFAGSENIKINHHSLNGIQLEVELKSRGESVFEVLPQNPRRKYVLSSFDIVKI